MKSARVCIPAPKQLADLAKRVKSDAESFECTFVEPFPKEVQTDCSICLHTLKEPYVVGCCGNRFCKACIEPATPLRFCPLCKYYNFQKLPDKQLERLLNQRIVYCLLRDSGCSWTGELNKLSVHLNLDNELVPSRGSCKKDVCEFLPIPCTYCKLYFRRIDMKTHNGECKSRPSVCKYCSYKCPFKDLVTHFKTCCNYPNACKNSCSDRRFNRKELEAHLANDCPLEMADCEYRYAGCRVKVLRRDMAAHMEEKLRNHLHLVACKCKVLLHEKEKKSTVVLQNCQQLKKDNEALAKQISDLVATNQILLEENILLRKIPNQKGEKDIQHISVTNLPPGANKHNLKCVFGQYGTVEHVNLKNGNTAIIKYSERDGYERAIEASMLRGVNLLKYRLQLQLIS